MGSQTVDSSAAAPELEIRSTIGLNVSVQANEQVRVVGVAAFDLAIPTWIVHDASDNVVDSYIAQGRAVTIAPTAAEHLERGLRRASRQCEVSSRVVSLAERSCLSA